MSLESVKAGDELLITSHFMSDDRLLKVDRVTKTQVIIGNSKYRVSDGRAIGFGGEWNIPRAIIPTFEQKEKVRIESAKKVLIERLKSKEITALQVDAMMSAFISGGFNGTSN